MSAISLGLVGQQRRIEIILAERPVQFCARATRKNGT
jgi:hypothetical protein